jgi:diaminohydroxyphosphoribosylaminopyrimidine deaminase / 5-amino-6-(5-phosphoribosylamino)uracil reductase
VLTDLDYMQRALFLAARGRGRTSPNPMVGAVVVLDGVVVGQGFHSRAGEPHAEVHALSAAGARARGATLYCTLEPCCHHGRTGPCTAEIVQAGISRVVAAMEDPNPLVKGKGFASLRAHGITVEVGVGAAEAIHLNDGFLTLMRKHRPFVVLKAATSLDGKIAAAPGRRTRLTSAPADQHAHAFRAEVDAIGIGSGTLLVDDPLLTARGPFRDRPLTRVIFDRRLRTPACARVLSTRDAGPVIIMTTASAAACTELRRPLEDRGARVEVVGDSTLRNALEHLGTLGTGVLLLEGGAKLQAAAWDDGLVDYVRLYVAPHALGPEGIALLDDRPFRSATLFDRRVQQLGPDVLIEGYTQSVVDQQGCAR